MKILTNIILTILVIVGLALILPGAMQWDALQIQAGLGNGAPLTEALVQMAGGMVCLAIAWVILTKTKEQ